jgi:hypothetical protein
VIIVAALAFVASCSSGGAAILVPITQVKDVDAKIVEEAILKSTRESGWRADILKPGLIRATLMQRKHLAIVDIEYTDKIYTIKYNDSQNLKYNSDRKSIHKNYNRWVNNLDRRIYRNIYKVSGANTEINIY